MAGKYKIKAKNPENSIKSDRCSSKAYDLRLSDSVLSLGLNEVKVKFRESELHGLPFDDYIC